MSKVSELLGKHAVENAELKAELEQLLAAAEQNNTDMIPKSRFSEVIKQRNEANAKIAELESDLEQKHSKIETLENEFSEAGKWKEELESFKAKQSSELRSNWLEKSKLLDVKETDKNFDKIAKIKSDFIFKENAEDYTDEEIAHNINAMKPYEKIGYFEATETNPGYEDKSGKKGKKVDMADHPVFGVLHK